MAMYTVMWTFNVPAGKTRADILANIKATAHTYLGIPGLIRKYYALAEDGKTMSGIYLWDSRAKAEAFYTPDWVAMVTKRWEGVPHRTAWDTPMVVEGRENRLVEAA
jgi:Putative mono-oxygenase ydhR